LLISKYEMSKHLCAKLIYARHETLIHALDVHYSATCGRPWPHLLVRRQGMSKIICPRSVRLVGAQNVQIRNGPRLIRPRHPVDQIGGYARGLCHVGQSRYVIKLPAILAELRRIVHR
jgi:hypothetical protein